MTRLFVVARGAQSLGKPWPPAPQVKGNTLLPPALSHDQITAVGYFTNYFSVGLDAQTATW